MQSVVLLQNREKALPLNLKSLRSLAVIGPLADDPYEQLGTWIFDGDPQYSQTPLKAIRDMVGDEVTILLVRAMETSRRRTMDGFADA